MSKFFTYEERLDLQKYLKDCLSFKEIARRLDKYPTTISSGFLLSFRVSDLPSRLFYL